MKYIYLFIFCLFLFSCNENEKKAEVLSNSKEVLSNSKEELKKENSLQDVPVKSSNSNSIDGWDSILSTKQTPNGIPTETEAITDIKNGGDLYLSTCDCMKLCLKNLGSDRSNRGCEWMDGLTEEEWHSLLDQAMKDCPKIMKALKLVGTPEEGMINY